MCIRDSGETSYLRVVVRAISTALKHRTVLSFSDVSFGPIAWISTDALRALGSRVSLGRPRTERRRMSLDRNEKETNAKPVASGDTGRDAIEGGEMITGGSGTDPLAALSEMESHFGALKRMHAEVARKEVALAEQIAAATRRRGEVEKLVEEAQADRAAIELERQQLRTEQARIVADLKGIEEARKQFEAKSKDIQAEAMSLEAARNAAAAEKARLGKLEAELEERISEDREAIAKERAQLKADQAKITGELKAIEQARGQAETRAKVLESQTKALEASRAAATAERAKIDKASEELIEQEIMLQTCSEQLQARELSLTIRFNDFTEMSTGHRFQRLVHLSI